MLPVVASFPSRVLGMLRFRPRFLIENPVAELLNDGADDIFDCDHALIEAAVTPKPRNCVVNPVGEVWLNRVCDVEVVRTQCARS